MPVGLERRFFMDGPASTCPLCHQMISIEEDGKLVTHFFDGEKCSRSETVLSRVEDTFAEHVLSEKASEQLLHAMKNDSARPKIPIRRLPTLVEHYNGYSIYDYKIGYLLIMSDNEYDFIQYPFYGIEAAKSGIDLLNSGKPLPPLGEKK
jgi:hypothetical protein